MTGLVNYNEQHGAAYVILLQLFLFDGFIRTMGRVIRKVGGGIRRNLRYIRSYAYSTCFEGSLADEYVESEMRSDLY